MKKLIVILASLIMCFSAFAGCNTTPSDNTGDTGQTTDENTGNTDQNTGDDGSDKPEPQPDWLDGASTSLKTNLSADGYVRGKIGDFSVYEGTEAYRKVTTADELIRAIADAKCHYDTKLEEDGTLTQTPKEGFTQENFLGSVRVIEIANDLDLGYNKLSAEAKSDMSLVEDYTRRQTSQKTQFTMSDMFLESGISQIKIENTSNLLIYSKNGAKLTHCGFKLTSVNNVAIRNLAFDELWQWEDTSNKTIGKVGDYDAFGWAYFKISFSGYVWIDHCTFGKSYDGQIDYSNPVYNNKDTAFRAPYGGDGDNGLHISWCNFEAGSDDKDGYLYKMMDSIEQNYQANLADNSVACKYLYYKALRDGGYTFEDILYGLAIPQKKGFLFGDDAKYTENDYIFNLKLKVSLANCKMTDLEDRLPKLRGGNAYMYNCVVDNSTYYSYREKLKPGASSKVTKVNSSWKCALTSQGIVCGNGGSVKAESCIFRGIAELVDHNDSKNSSPYCDGGYQIINCVYQRGQNDKENAISTEGSNVFASTNMTKLNPAKFKWIDGVQPFNIRATMLSKLETTLNSDHYGVGTRVDMGEKCLKSSY